MVDKTFAKQLTIIQKLENEVDMIVHVVRARLDMSPSTASEWMVIRRQLHTATTKAKRVVTLLDRRSI